MDRRTFLGAWTGSLLAAPVVARAQPAGDAVELGLVASLARAGGNVTGQTIIADEPFNASRSGTPMSSPGRSKPQ